MICGLSYLVVLKAVIYTCCKSPLPAPSDSDLIIQSEYNYFINKIMIKTGNELVKSKNKKYLEYLFIVRGCYFQTLLLFREGFLLFEQPGYYEEDKLEDISRQSESINMEEVRSHFEAEKIA